MKFLKTLLKNLHLANIIKVLNDSNTTWEIITVGEERFLESLYGYSGANVFSLNYLRHVSDKKSVFRHNSKIVALPPSTVAAQLYITRSSNSCGLEKRMKSGDGKEQTHALSLFSLH